MENRGYFSRSWEMLTHDKGWIKPLLVMACAEFVPLVGGLGNKGYALEWARLTAWGVDSSPKQKNVDVGQCILSGWRGFLVDFVWGLVAVLATWTLLFIAAIFPGVLGILLSGLLSFVTTIIGVFWTSVQGVAKIRAAIYERTTAGLRFDRVFEMIGRDFSGFLRVLVIGVVTSIIVSFVAAIMILIVGLELMPAIISTSYNGDTATLISIISGSIVIVLMTCALFGFVLAFLANAVRMICLTATAVWMRQFNVPQWGRSEDPLPGESVPQDRPVSPHANTPQSSVTPVATSESRRKSERAGQEAALPSTASSPAAADSASVSYDGLLERVRNEVAQEPVDERAVDELVGAMESMVAKNDEDLHDAR